MSQGWNITLQTDELYVTFFRVEQEMSLHKNCNLRRMHKIKEVLRDTVWSLVLLPDGSQKGKEVPLQAWSGPEGSRKLRFPDFMTTAQDGGKVVSITHRPPFPQEIHLVLISVRAESTPGP